MPDQYGNPTEEELYGAAGGVGGTKPYIVGETPTEPGRGSGEPEPTAPEPEQRQQSDLERVQQQERSYTTPPPVSDEEAKQLAANPPTMESSVPQTVIDINRRIAAGEKLTEAEEKAAKVHLQGSYDFYRRIHEKPQQPKIVEALPTDYYESVADWKKAGRPGGTAEKNVIIGLKPPAGQSYTRPDDVNVVETADGRRVPGVWVGTDRPDQRQIIELTPELDAIRKSNPRLWQVLELEGIENYNRAVNAENFVRQQEIKRQAGFSKQLEPFRDGDSYRLDEAIVAGVTPATLSEAGFNAIVIRDAQESAKYLRASPVEKFAILQTKGLIPKNAEFNSLDKDGNISYFIPTTASSLRSPLPLLGQVEQPSGATDKVTAKIARTPQELDVMSWSGLDTGIPILPIVGTAYMIYRYKTAGNKTFSKRDIALSAAFDVLPFLPVGKMLGSVKGVLSPGAKEVAAVNRAISSGVSASRATIKKLTNKETVKAFDDMVKASRKYAENLNDIKVAERVVKNSEIAKSAERDAVRLADLGRRLEVARDIFRSKAGTKEGDTARKTISEIQANIKSLRQNPAMSEPMVDELAKLRTVTSELKQTALQKAYSFSEKLARTQAGDVPLADATREASQMYVRNIEDIVARVHSGQPYNPAQLSKQLRNLQRGLETARFDKDEKQITEIGKQLAELKSKIRLAYVAEASRLQTERRIITDRIKVLKRDIVRLRDDTEELVGNQSLQGIKDEIKNLEKRLGQIDDLVVDTTKKLEVEWAEPIPRSRGGGGVTTEPKAPPTRYGGGGVRLQAQSRPLSPAVVGLKVVYQSIDGDIEWAVPLPQITVPGRETIRVEPQPYWGTVEAPIKPATRPATEPLIPETEPARREPFDPQPGKITWTPSVVLSPRLKQGTYVQSGTQIRQLTRVEVDSINKAVDKVRAMVSEGWNPADAIQEVNKEALAGTEVQLQQQTAAQTGASAQVKSSAQQKQQAQSRTQTRQRTQEQVRARQQAQTRQMTQVRSQVQSRTQEQTKTGTGTDIDKPPPPPKPPPPSRKPPARLPKPGAGSGKDRRQITLGSIAWRQGFNWRYIPPPYADRKPQSLGRTPPIGADTSGRTPAETVQIIGEPESKVPALVRVDIGIADVEIVNGRTIRFAGGGLRTNVGNRIENTTQGMSVDEPSDELDFRSGGSGDSDNGVWGNSRENRRKHPKQKAIQRDRTQSGNRGLKMLR